MAKVGLIAVLLVGAFSYGVYAMDYQGNYNLTISGSVERTDIDDAVFRDFDATSEPTEVMQFWSVLLKGSDNARLGNFTVYGELNQSGVIRTATPVNMLIQVVGQEQKVSLEFSNVPAGQATVRIYILWTIYDQIVYDQTTGVLIG